MDWDERDLTEYLDYIPCGSLSYQEWVNVGMALKHEGYPCNIWEAWSRNDSRFKEGECVKKWQTFNGAAEPVTGGTIIEYAKQYGYDPVKNDELLDWDDEIGVDKYDLAWVEPEEVEEAEDLNPYDQIVTYLNALFEPEEKVSIVMKSFRDEDGRYKPSGRGSTRNVKDLLKDLTKHKKDVCAALGDYNPEAGAWVRFNPMDGNGVKNDNVTAYRYALVESDSMPIEMQNALIREMKLPVAVLVSSGGKSLHAIVKVNAKDHDTYRKRVEKLYAVCDKYGLKVDRQNKNASRLSRLPGIKRGDKWQHIVDYTDGFDTFEEWDEWISGEMDDLPDVEDIFAIEPLELSPEVISGILRQGHKMSVTGPSKAGKSFLLMELAIATASGCKWLGLDCMKGKTLYVNLEIDKASCQHRFFDICKELDIDPKALSGQLDVWNMRGRSAPMDKLLPSLLRRCQKASYKVVIIDPIYKTLTGDENSASEMARFCNEFDKFCNRTGASLIYAHHHSKGAQGGKNAIDRSSGSGVFARDPDAIVDLIELSTKMSDGLVVETPEGSTAWRIETTLREFRPLQPFEVVFDHPVHRVWDGLADAKEAYGERTRAEKQAAGNATQTKNKERRDNELVVYLCKYNDLNGEFPRPSEVADYFKKKGRKGFSETVLKDKANPASVYYVEGLSIEKGRLVYTPPDFEE